ncbi:MAG: GNAT family N-acetyltransferase [bacterium]|nr:GNAT family N-acetyltransferase [bacterium]
MIKLVKPEKIDENEFNSFIDEFNKADEDLIPCSLDQKGLNFQSYIKSLNDESLGKNLPVNYVPSSTFFLTDDQGQIYGAVNIRHKLTDRLMIEGGHIGYGVRPSARGHGYGIKILKFALKKAEKIGIKHVLVTCKKQNVNSAKVIENNGGKFDSEIEYNKNISLRYWIELE